MEEKNWEMNVGQLITKLKTFKPTARVLVSSDEELNTLFQGIEVCNLQTNGDKTGEDTVVFFGLSGLEFEEEFEDEE